VNEERFWVREKGNGVIPGVLIKKRSRKTHKVFLEGMQKNQQKKQNNEWGLLIAFVIKCTDQLKQRKLK